MDVTQRFSDRVGDYVKARPGYPPALLDSVGVEPGWTVADLGSGTGLLARVFLEAGHAVWGVEPNEAMRTAGERELAPFPQFHSRDGRAEATGLADASIDLAVAGQAFHWFEPEPTRRELQRILRGPRLLALVWNDRNEETPFERAYLALMEDLAPEYRALRTERSGDEVVEAFMPVRKATFPGFQDFDEAGLKGRLYSSSCMPAPGPAVDRRIEELFAACQVDGLVRLTYTTRLYWGVPG